MIINNQLSLTGVVLAFAGTSAPSGFLLCDGSPVSRSTYSGLFAIIGVSHGQGNGTTTFNLPDYRGQFLRGVDGSAGRDPNNATRTAMASGGNTGNNIGSVQGDALQGHRHPYDASVSGSVAPGLSGQLRDFSTSLLGSGTAIKDPTTDGVNGIPRTSSETRPTNAYVNFIIKT